MTPTHEVTFAVPGRPELGTVIYAGSSRTFFQEGALDAGPAVDAIEGPICALLSVEGVAFIAKNGPRAGRRVEYVTPVLQVLEVPNRATVMACKLA